MKILTNRIKRWSFKQRLYEMHRRLQNVKNAVDSSKNLVDVQQDMVEAMQILDYWMKNMSGEIEKQPENPKPKKKKPVNLWE